MAAASNAGEERDAPRSAYGLIESPEIVVIGLEFEIRVGLSPEPPPGVTGGPLVRPETSIGPYTLTVQVVADGFAIRGGESWRRDLPVTTDAAYPTFTLHLTAHAQQGQVPERTIQATYSVDGQMMGLAVRPVAVVPTDVPLRMEGREFTAMAGPSPRYYADESPRAGPPPWPGERRMDATARAEPPASDDELVAAPAEPPPMPEPTEVRTPAAVSREVRDPPRSAYGLIESPEKVVARVEFEIGVGLSPEPPPGVIGGLLVRPETSVGPYTLTVQVVADGFAIRDEESWRRDLRVTAEAAYPTFALHLTAGTQQEQVRARTIQAIYSVDGQTLGLAVRPVAVVRTADLLDQAPTQPADGRIGLAVPTSEVSADLTVRIQRGDSESGGRLLWTFDTPHRSVELPSTPLVTDIGKDPDQFARHLVDGVGVHEGKPGLHAYLLGVGTTIADEMPSAFWDVLRETAQLARAQGRQPTVFILSEEPYVPWELAVVDPPLDPDTAVPPFLGAQACVGRWVLGHRRPELPPFGVQVGSIAVISGAYDQPGWNRLEEAEEEAATLEQAYGAIAVQANTTEVLRCLSGIPKADLLHFAVHGIYDPNSVMNGLVLVDASTLDPLQVKARQMASAPFVFLNACQVGSGNTVLGDYSGMAEAFLYAGASGVIAPLWSIKDTIAKEIALRFYQEVFGGVTPADMLRRERAAFRDSVEPVSATCLAYLFYGHPALKLSRLTR